MITLAVITGISAEQWGREGARAIATAWDVLEEAHKSRQANQAGRSSSDGPQYSG